MLRDEVGFLFVHSNWTAVDNALTKFNSQDLLEFDEIAVVWLNCAPQRITQSIIELRAVPIDTVRNLRTNTSRNVKRFQGGIVFQAHRLVYHSTLGLRVIKKKKRTCSNSTRLPLYGLEPYSFIVIGSSFLHGNRTTALTIFFWVISWIKLGSHQVFSWI